MKENPDFQDLKDRKLEHAVQRSIVPGPFHWTVLSSNVLSGLLVLLIAFGLGSLSSYGGWMHELATQFVVWMQAFFQGWGH